MTVRAVDLARIVRGIEEPYEVERFICHVAWCVESVSHAHHVMARGPMAGAYDWLEVRELIGADGPDLGCEKTFLVGNLVGLCVQHHNDIHSHKAAIRLAGRAWEFEGDGCKGLLNPRAPVRTLTEGDGLSAAVAQRAPLLESTGTGTVSAPSVSVPPGQDCDKCGRRVPHPRKSTSPKSKTFGFRVPLDEVDEFAELLDAAAEHWGVKEKPHHKYRLILDALVLVLQTKSKDAA